MKYQNSSLLAAGLLAAGAAHAAVVVETSDLFNSFTASTTISFSQVASSDTVLLFAVAGENPPGTVSATYDPSGLNLGATPLATVNQSDAWVSIFGLDLDGVSAGPIDISVGGGSGTNKSAVSIIQLSGATLTGFGQATDTAINGSVTTAPDFSGLDSGSFILSAVAAKQGNGGWTADGTPTLAQSYTGSGWTSGLSYQTDTTGVVLSWTHSDNTDNHALAAVAIAPVPEPATYALISGMLVFGLIVLRRRQRAA
jgi:hypothetical protein